MRKETDKDLLKGVTAGLEKQSTAFQRRIFNFIRERETSSADKAAIDVQLRDSEAGRDTSLGWLQTF